MNGILENGAEPPCPVCGEPLGYYAELGDETECDNCGSIISLERVTEIHYTVIKIGSIKQKVKERIANALMAYKKSLKEIGGLKEYNKIEADETDALAERLGLSEDYYERG